MTDAIAEPWPRAKFTCALCGACSMTVSLVGPEAPFRSGATGPRAVGVISDTGTFQLWTALGELGDGDAVRRMVRDADAQALHSVDPELVPYWCPGCSAAYCDAHWTTWPIFEDDFPGGWFDELRGQCPEGHGRRIHD